MTFIAINSDTFATFRIVPIVFVFAAICLSYKLTIKELREAI